MSHVLAAGGLGKENKDSPTKNLKNLLVNFLAISGDSKHFSVFSTKKLTPYGVSEHLVP
jgi:hypothetical protein